MRLSETAAARYSSGSTANNSQATIPATYCPMLCYDISDPNIKEIRVTG